MITAEQIKHLIPQGETTAVQFKIRSEDAYKMGVEMVAFSNTQGGMLIIGVNNKTGAISGLSFEEIQQTNELLANAASHLSGIQKQVRNFAIKCGTEMQRAIYLFSIMLPFHLLPEI